MKLRRRYRTRQVAYDFCVGNTTLLHTLGIAAVVCLALFVGGCEKEDGVKGALEGAKIEATFEGKTLSHWIEQLSDEDVNTRRRAAKAFGQMGQDALDGLPALEEALGNPKEDAVVRFVAAMSIWAISQDASRVVPPLSLMLRSPDLDVCYRGALGLEMIGPPASAAVPPLQKIVDKYGGLNYAKLTFDEQLLLATAKDAIGKIEGDQEP